MARIGELGWVMWLDWWIVFSFGRINQGIDHTIFYLCYNVVYLDKKKLCFVKNDFFLILEYVVKFSLIYSCEEALLRSKSLKKIRNG